MLFDRFILKSFLWVFLSVSFAGVFIVSLYALADFLVGFKVKNLEIALQYFLYLLPLGFYYVSPLLISVALFLFLKRVIDKKTDLIIQSFGVSPLRFSLPLLLLSLLLSLIFLSGNQFLFPDAAKKLWFIEKTYKKKQKIEGIVRNFWFLKKEEAGNKYYFVEYLDLSTKRFANFFFLDTEEFEPTEYIKAKSGSWIGTKLFIEKGFKYNFREGKLYKLNYVGFDVGLSIRDLELFAEKIDFLSLYELYRLAQRGKLLGYNPDVYLGEILFRFNFSFLPFILSVLIIYLLLKTRSVKRALLVFLVFLPVIWVALLYPKVGTQKANQPILLTAFPPLIIYLLVLKGIHNLRKGFRV
ncbi:LptF/LptG family permease [Aquifex sp.]